MFSLAKDGAYWQEGWDWITEERAARRAGVVGLRLPIIALVVAICVGGCCGPPTLAD